MNGNSSVWNSVMSMAAKELYDLKRECEYEFVSLDLTYSVHVPGESAQYVLLNMFICVDK